MIVKRVGKCEICYCPTSESRDFPISVDMFEPDRPVKISGDLKKQIEDWRGEKLRCEAHR